MRTLLLLLLSISLSLSASAQKIHFTDTSNVWKELQPQYNDNNPWILNYYTYSYADHATFDSMEYRNFGFGWVREDTILKKVYYKNLITDSDIVLMDYNLNVGDTFYSAYAQFPVIGTDSTLINSIWYKVWYFPFYTGGWYTGTDTISVIEGIGCIEHPTFMLWNTNSCVECGQPSMYCFSNNGITPPLSPQVEWLDNTTSCTTFPTLNVNKIQANNKITIYPNPTTNSLTITSLQNISTLSISNLLGQTIYTKQYNSEQVEVDASSFPSGIYFAKVNGTEVRKFVKQ